ncbi:radical SAM protein [Persicobacter psychrovividus]|uniref:Radical SAM protein n=1 Tax=Persicobacter psychrovividus TaxID=387638 RepID=A0ABM7VC50_9BACT|nr:radical SAM protein [Persicobacter psychrovividus]
MKESSNIHTAKSNDLKHPDRVPYLLACDAEGNMFEEEDYEVIGRSGTRLMGLKPEDFIELPEGSEFFNMPCRHPYGMNKHTGEVELLEDVYAVAAFVSPAYTQTFMPAYEETDGAETLPLYAYTAVGWLDDKFYTTAVRIDPDPRQDFENFDCEEIEQKTVETMQEFSENRLIQHLGANCSLTYSCPAARNFFMGRWEAPIPLSPACNSNCLGCISFQPDEHGIDAMQNRIDFIPYIEEVIEMAVPHLENAPLPIVSFGQGCEGEPLLVWQLIRDVIVAIRKRTKRGIINLNTNGSKPKAVDELFKAGLDSIRVSMNSVRKDVYNKYYLPNNYEYEDVIESIKVARQHGKWASINYFTLPGFTDNKEEFETLRQVIRYTDLSMIQWRNFNIDLEWYLSKLGMEDTGEGLGVAEVMEAIHEEFPHIAYGYFNPPIEVQEKYNALREK